MHQTMDQSDKSTYPAKWVWCLIMHGKIPRNSEMGSAEGILNLIYFDPEDNVLTGAILEKMSAFQRSQNDWKKQVTILGYAVDVANDIHGEMLKMIRKYWAG